MAPELAAEQITVRELMRLETEIALENARRRKQQGAGVAGAVVASASRGGVTPGEASGSLRLVGIYGVGKRLFAEVRNGERALLFLKGNSLPLGQPQAGGQYRLKAFVGSCVRLDDHGRETELCLNSGGGH